MINFFPLKELFVEFLPQIRASLFLRINVEIIFSESFHGFDEECNGIIYVFSIIKDFKVFVKNVCRIILSSTAV